MEVWNHQEYSLSWLPGQTEWLREKGFSQGGDQEPDGHWMAWMPSVMYGGSQALLTSRGQYHPYSEAWWWQHHAGTCRLFRIEGKINAAIYWDILEENLLQSTVKWRFMFQQENDPKHTAKMTKEWLWENSVNVLEWPSQSPDLNLISGESWKWLCTDTPHPTWWSLRGPAKKNGRNCPKIGVPSL